MAIKESHCPVQLAIPGAWRQFSPAPARVATQALQFFLQRIQGNTSEQQTGPRTGLEGPILKRQR
jgi:hypothetical protein